MSEKKLLICIISIFVFAFVLELRLTQIMCSDYHIKAENQTIKKINLSPARAEIVDSSFRNITGTQQEMTTLISSDTQDIQNIFSHLTEKDKATFQENLDNSKQFLVTLDNPLQDKPLYLISKRYSQNNMAQHLIGYLNQDGVGVTGIEKALNDKLQNFGEQTELTLNVDGMGRVYGDVTSKLSVRSSLLSLTIDNTIQRIAESVAKEYIPNGSITIMETHTGKIRAMASTPTYNPNDLSASLNAENSPLLNKSLQVYEPGSVIKPLWASLALERGYNPNAIYECKGITTINGHSYHCANQTAHGKVDMNKAIEVSCNCYFINLFFKDKDYWIKQLANQTQFGSPIELCENYYTNTGYFPSYEDLDDLGELSSVSFGQGKFLLSPIHVTAYMNIFANNGIYVSPKIAQGIYDSATHELTESLYEYNAKQLISEDTANIVKEMLVNMVENGASGRAKPENLTAGGKTGTAQTGLFQSDGDEVFNAWFSGFYPAENPQYTITVHLYDGGESSQTATRIFKKICEQLYFIL